MTSKTGFFKSNLQDTFPRGARRVARAIVEIINANPDHKQTFICLDEYKITNSRPLSFFFDPLGDWLKNNPLSQKTTSKQIFPLGAIKTIIRSLIPPIFYPFIKTVIYFAKLLILKFKELINKILKNSISNPIPISSNSMQVANIVAVCELDAFIAFEPFNEIWMLPVENSKALAIGWFYDAVPKRIHEGEHWRPDLFDYSVSLMALRANHIFCDSKSAQEDLHYFYPASLGKTSVIHLGHDIERFQKRVSFAESTQMLLSFSIDPNIPYFIFVGSVEPRKNIAGLLLAAQKLKLINPLLPFQLILVGQIAGQKEIQSLIKQTNKFLPVHALNYLADDLVPTLMNRAEGFVFPSKWEGFGIPILEAMTAETLVITSNLSSMPEVAEEHALYCDPYDHTSIALQMIKCLEMPKEERVERLKAAKLHASLFTWEKTAKKMMETIHQLLQARKET